MFIIYHQGSHDRANGCDMFWRLSCLAFCFALQLRVEDGVIAQTSPSSGDYAECELIEEEKEKFMDQHNEYRGMVSPQAADMEYLLWDENLANLAQMWANKCLFSHGFYEFGNQYPVQPPPFQGEVGQNLAREVGELQDPVDRVTRWFNERENYIYSKYTAPNGGICSKRPCGHYTQIAWAKAKYIGCAVNYCNSIYPPLYTSWGSGDGTIVACDYDVGNTYDQYPYQTGKPCSKCASGKGFCYKNLCRDCKDFDRHCGTAAFSQAMCTTHPELMEKKCPKMCEMCKCPLVCQNGGTVNNNTCTCACSPGWKSTDCSDRCRDVLSKQRCAELKRWTGCENSYLKENCEGTCGYCDDGSGTFTTTVPPEVITTTPTPPPTTVTTSVAVTTNPVTTVPVTTTTAPQVVCKEDLHPSCAGWAAIGECEKNPLWMIPNCCVSCKYHQAPKECTDLDKDCPRWAYHGQCEVNRLWMLENCRRSCNQCGDCKDTDSKCPSWALLKQCSSGDRINWMNSNCRRSCGLCRVYDRHAECPAWHVMGECTKSNWTWMTDHCPRSCGVELTEALFCGGKSDGNYQAPSTCKGYIACSHGVTSHVECPSGKSFDTFTRICQSVDQASCRLDDGRETFISPWKTIVTLKRG